MWRFLVAFALASTASARYHDHGPMTRRSQVTTDMFGAPDPVEYRAAFWYSGSENSLRDRLALTLRTGPAKNVIMFLGDGMSIATVTAARILLGQLSNQPGEEQRLSFENFPFTGLSKTYCVDSQVADSACSGTAYLSGVKTNIKTIGVTASVKYKDWRAMQNSSFYTPSILQWAQEAGKGTGIVTTCKVTDASPAATYSHTANRNWQTDLDIKADAPDAFGIQDIASQLMENSPGSNIKVILGGGREVFLPQGVKDEEGNNGTRGDGKNLLETWKSTRDLANVSSSYVFNRTQLRNIDVSSTDYLLGLFHPGDMEYHQLADPEKQPTLAEMTTVAIKMMQKEKNGYFLFIEGGRIDHGHHENKAHLALDETIEFHRAIQIAATMTSEVDTLIVVTADHAHTMTMSGYPSRGSDIFTTLQDTTDNLTYSTLSYANGPNTYAFDADGSRHNIMKDDRGNVNYTFPTVYTLASETHDGQDVGVWARGPSAHLFTGSIEQTNIAHTMGYAARIGPVAQAFIGSSASVSSCSLVLTILIVAFCSLKFLD